MCVCVCLFTIITNSSASRSIETCMHNYIINIMQMIMISKLHKDNIIKDNTYTHLTHIHPTTKLAPMFTSLKKQFSLYTIEINV